MQGDLLDGTQLGKTERARAANAVLLALSRAGRSFLLYDAHNEAIRGFLQDYREAHTRFAKAHGTLDLVVRPFELVYADEVVYLERDRERSLAFKMFRDGVRRVTLKSTVTWDELLRLLEILSIRFTGVRQQEDDLVTLLWKAGFKHIDLEAIEGVTPDEEDEEQAEESDKDKHGAPPDRDLPLPVGAGARAAFYDDVDDEALEALRAESDSRTLPANAARLATLLLECVADPVDPTQIQDVRFYIEELRDFLMAEEQLALLVQYTRAVQEALGHDDLTLKGFHAGFGRAGLRRLVRSIQKNHTSVPSELFELLAAVPGEHLKELVSLLQSERDAGSRRVIRQLLEEYVSGNEAWIMGQVLAAEPDVAKDLLRALGSASPDEVVTLAPDLAQHPDPGLLDELLWQLDKLDRSAHIDRVVVEMLQSSNDSVVQRAAELASKRGYAPAYEHMARRVETGLADTAAEAVGVAMVSLNPRGAQETFRGWIRPGGLRSMFGRTGSGAKAWAAIGGLERLQDAVDDDIVEHLIKKGEGVLVDRARACLVRRRHLRGEG